MTLIRPFAALRPAPGRAQEVIAPPYDVLNSEEARMLAAGKPFSFLHISKPEIDLPPDIDPYSKDVYEKAAENLNALIASGVLIQDEKPAYYAYRLIMGRHTQTGLVVAASIAAYDENRIKKHEFTRPDKEDDRVRQIEALRAQTGPVLLASPDSAAIESLIEAKVRSAAPDADAVSDSGVRHTLWVISDEAAVTQLTELFNNMPALYIADGHHRSAAASRVAALMRQKAGTRTSADYFLAVVFPSRQMRILDYNRLVRDLNGMNESTFLDKVSEKFLITSSDGAVSPSAPGEFGLYLKNRWYKLQVKGDLIPSDPVGRLDVSLLQNHLIGPILGIDDPRRDKRIDFVGGIRGLPELERRVDSGEMVLALSLYPTPMTDLMSVADSGEVMPPKSTWFEPKLADGMASYMLD